MDVQRSFLEIKKHNLAEQFYKLMEEFFISKALFMMEYDKKKSYFLSG